MAIEKTTFTGATAAENQAELYAWLTANATDLFDGITNDTNAGTITCTVNGVTAVVFTCGTSVTTTIYLNGTADTTNYVLTGTLYKHAYKTSNGIAIRSYHPTSTNIASTAWLFVFKTSANTVGAVYDRFVGTGASSLKLTFVDFERNNDFYAPFGSSTSRGTPIKEASLMALTPIPCGDGETSANGAFMSTFTELYDTTQHLNKIIDIGGTKYVYNGVIAFRE